MNKIFNLKNYSIELIIPKQIGLFIKAANIDIKELLDKDLWCMNVEDNIFGCHDRHPSDKDFKRFAFAEPLTNSKKITVVITGCYLHSRKIFELETNELLIKKPLFSGSTNIKSGWRIYYSVL